MRTAEIEEMRGLRIFQDVDERRVDAMLKSSFLQRFPAGVELVREGEMADFLHVVVEGQVEVFSGYRDRETTVSVLGAGQCFIMAAVILDRVYLKSVRSLTQARVLLIPADAVRRYFAEDAAFARCLACDLAEAYRMVVKELKNQKLRSGLERLANWLLAYRAENGESNRIELPFEKKVLAARLGMAPEVLSRSFAALAPYKVKVIGPTIEIRDVVALTKLAQPSSTIDDPST
jgi:CRP/FNR family transcriptional activator FtrB